MWRIFRRFLGRETLSLDERGPQASRVPPQPETTLLYLRIPARQPTASLAPDVAAGHAATVSAPAPIAARSVPPAARPPQKSDLPAADRRENSPASRPDQAAARQRARRQRAIRFAKHFPGMNPREARVLMAIHRRSPHVLARESAAVLKRDWERFLLSSRGQRFAATTGVPDVARVRGWISLAQAKLAASTQAKLVASTQAKLVATTQARQRLAAAETSSPSGQL